MILNWGGEIFRGDCLDILNLTEDNSVDSIVTDPPYGFGFMGKKWDYSLPSIEIWRECLRVLKPGGHLISFGGPRTYHRMACNVEDAGFQIRDQIQWLFGSGFPKSLDVSKAIDKAAGAEREVVGTYASPEGTSGRSDGSGSNFGIGGLNPITVPATDAAKQWAGWGTALKPANEPILLARKPLSEKTVAANVVKWGTGGINVDGCRIRTEPTVTNHTRCASGRINGSGICDGSAKTTGAQTAHTGRFPANLLLDETASQMLDEQSGTLKTGGPKTAPTKPGSFGGGGGTTQAVYTGDTGGASRFFYVAKASRKERNSGLSTLPDVPSHEMVGRKQGSKGMNSPRAGAGRTSSNQNFHPTVKPLKLMEYLCRLITPENGLILDPFMGSGTTGIAARNLKFRFLGIELDNGYFKISKMRLKGKK